MNVRFIPEIGSTHNGVLDKCFEAIDKAAELGLTDVKFQCLGTKQQTHGNIAIHRDWWPDIFSHGDMSGINVIVSAWEADDIKYLQDAGLKTLKLAYGVGKKFSYQELQHMEEIIFSSDHVYTTFELYLPCPIIALLCIPRYPVYEQLSFDNCFPPFHGFSDHTLGFRQTVNAVKAGATVIEKHVNINPDRCHSNDSKFSVTWDEVKIFLDEIER